MWKIFLTIFLNEFVVWFYFLEKTDSKCFYYSVVYSSHKVLHFNFPDKTEDVENISISTKWLKKWNQF